MYFHKVAALFYLAAAQSSSAQLYAITTPGLRGRQLQNIPDCGMTLTVGCKIVEPFVADSCENIFKPQNQCGNRRVRVTYEICNNMNGNGIRFNKVANENFAEVNAESFESVLILDDLAQGSCRTLSKARTFDTCTINMLFVRSKMEGWALGTDVSDDSKWCFQYEFLKIMKPVTLIPTTKHPTMIFDDHFPF